MNVKSVVKVMNFHALLRVESSRRQAELYGNMENELASMMRIIMNNRNLRLDKLIKIPDSSLPKLKIYIGSDLGFCGSINSSVNSVLTNGEDCNRVVVGKRLKKNDPDAVYFTREDLANGTSSLKAIFEKALEAKTWSSVELVYNHYYNISSIKQIEKTIFPLSPESDSSRADEKADFLIEGDPATVFKEMMLLYMTYEFKIAMVSAYASENVLRQNATTESLKKLDERELEETRIRLKERTQQSVTKTIDSYVKQKVLENNG